jgi:hypothetical protein
MTKPEQPTAAANVGTAEAEHPVSGKFVGYFLLFVLLVFVFYVFPEYIIFKRHGFAPVEHLVDTGANPSLGDVFASMWRDRAQLLNPFNNPLVRFFLVTVLVGVVFDKVKKYRPAE